MKTTGFGLSVLKAEGTPMHPVHLIGITSEQYDRQLLAYFDYWRSRQLKNLSRHPDYARYKTLREQHRGRKDDE